MATKIFEQFHFSYTVDYHDNSSIVSKSSMAKIWLDSVVFLLCSFVDLLAPPRALIVTLTFWRPSRTHPHRSSIINPSYSIHIWRQLGTTWELHEQHLGTTIWRHLGFPNWDNFETPFGTILSHFLGHLWDTFWDNFGTALINALASFKTKLGQLWDNFRTTFGQLWYNFQTALEQLLDSLRENLGIILGWFWDNFETTSGQLSGNF